MSNGLGDMIPFTPMATVPLWRQTILLHGGPKIGKSTEVSKLKNALYLDTGQETLGLEVPTFENLLPGRDRLNSPIKLWRDVLKATDILEKAAGKGIEG